MKRYQIAKKIKQKIASVEKLKIEILELNRADTLISDKNQQFTEQEEDVLILGRKRRYEKKMVGRIHWKEKFIDESNGKPIIINRSRVVRINGEWQ